VKHRDRVQAHETLKTLVVAFGPREAARQAGLSENTVLSLARRKHWKQALPGAQISTSYPHSKSNHSPADALATALNGHKSRSIFALGKWTAEAAEEAARHPEKLRIAKRVRDVAGVHSVLWPTEAKPGLLRVGILIGSERVIDIPAAAHDVPTLDVTSSHACPDVPHSEAIAGDNVGQPKT
jgi:hypothetical protein